MTDETSQPGDETASTGDETPAATPAPEAAPTPAPQAPAGKTFKFEVGDTVSIPGHTGSYFATVVKRYSSLEAAVDQYEASFRTILSSPFGRAKEDQNFYYCEVNNSTHKHVGVAEEHATLKRAAAE